MRQIVPNERLAELKARIAAIERQKLPERTRPPEGDSPSLLALTRPLPGILQEIHADAPTDSGGALGFALGLARELVGPARPAVFFLQLAHEAQEAGLPYALGLAGFGLAAGAGWCSAASPIRGNCSGPSRKPSPAAPWRR